MEEVATKLANALDIKAKFGIFYKARPRGNHWVVVRIDVAKGTEKVIKKIERD